MWAMIAGNVVEAQELEPPGCRETGFMFFWVGLRGCGGVAGRGVHLEGLEFMICMDLGYRVYSGFRVLCLASRVDGASLALL